MRDERVLCEGVEALEIGSVILVEGQERSRQSLAGWKATASCTLA